MTATRAALPRQDCGEHGQAAPTPYAVNAATHAARKTPRFNGVAGSAVATFTANSTAGRGVLDAPPVRT